MSALRKQAASNPELKVLLEDELVKHHEMRDWKYGFLAMTTCLGILGVLAIFIGLTDTVSVIFTALWAGIGGYHVSFSYMEKE